MTPGAIVEATMGVHYRPQLGAARQPIPPRRVRHHRHTEKHRRDLWDMRAVVWTLASIVLVLVLLALSRVLLHLWSAAAR